MKEMPCGYNNQSLGISILQNYPPESGVLHKQEYVSCCSVYKSLFIFVLELEIVVIKLSEKNHSKLLNFCTKGPIRHVIGALLAIVGLFLCTSFISFSPL